MLAANGVRDFKELCDAAFPDSESICDNYLYGETQTLGELDIEEPSDKRSRVLFLVALCTYL